ncbi:hypothetical protein [Streptomyces sp. N35]|uniref:hypothetical protein n=1 Tax=Streptomyces sp. N35 TaxID=2795730 RepID=UPI0018F5BE75|nr:hypothetical protein [Streptomyces sp. N35]
MTNHSSGPACGNNPNYRLSDGDQAVVDEFRAFLVAGVIDAPPALWAQLVEWQPSAAAALALYVRGLPDDWAQRVFGVGRPDAALALPAGAAGEQYADRAPEIAPPDRNADCERCPACQENNDELCRYHDGHLTADNAAGRALLDAVKAQPDITLRQYVRWQADVADAVDQGWEPPDLPTPSNPASRDTALQTAAASEHLEERGRGDDETGQGAASGGASSDTVVQHASEPAAPKGEPTS